MSDTPEIAAIRAIWTPDDAPHGVHILDTVPFNTTVAMAQSHIATLLAALEEAQAREAALRAALAEVAAFNPYPADVFTPLTALEEFAVYDALRATTLRHPVDRTYAHWGRAVLANVQALLQQRPPTTP